MKKESDLVCTNPDCDYRDDVSNPNQKGLTSNEPIQNCPKCGWPMKPRKK